MFAMSSSPSSLMSYLPVLPAHDRLWLEIIYAENRQNRKLTTPQVRSRLKDQLPRNYDPQSIDRKLIHPNHEEITPLGIIAITGNDDILEKGDQVIRTLQDMLLAHPDMQRVDTIDVASRCGLPPNEIGLLCHFIWYYGKPFQSYGSKTPGYFGAEFVTFDRYNTDGLMQFTSMRELLMAHLEREENLPDDDKVADQKAPTGLQVLTLHYLLKACGIESTEYKTETAKLVQFLTGKETGTKRIQDTTIYKKVSRPFKLNDQSVLQDLQAIRPFFVNLGLQKAVDLIDHEIKASQRQEPRKGTV